MGGVHLVLFFFFSFSSFAVLCCWVRGGEGGGGGGREERERMDGHGITSTWGMEMRLFNSLFYFYFCVCKRMM